MRRVEVQTRSGDRNIAPAKLTLFPGDGKTIDLNITPESGSSCSIATAALAPAPALEANVKSAYVNMLNFTLENCNAGETVAVAITLSEDPPADGIAYKYQGGQWRVIAGASISGRTISYNLTDNGPLDADPTSAKSATLLRWPCRLACQKPPRVSLPQRATVAP